MDATTVDAEVDGLYALPLEQFTAARNALAKRVKKEGDADAAASVAALAKPTKAAGALNHVAREHPAPVDALLAAGERLRAAQEAAIAGDRSDLRPATTALGDAVAAVAEAAAEQAGAGQRDRITATLRTAAIDEAAGATLRAGRLTGDLEASGLGLGLMSVPAAPTRAARAAKKEAPPTRAQARRPSPALVREAERLARDADRLEREAERLAKAAADTQRRAERAAAEASDARRAADEKAAELAKARGA